MKTRVVLKNTPTNSVETRCPAVKTCSPQVPHRVFCSFLPLFRPFLRFRETVFVKNVVFQEHGNSLLSKFAISLWFHTMALDAAGLDRIGPAQRQSKEDRRARHGHSAKPKRRTSFEHSESQPSRKRTRAYFLLLQTKEEDGTLGAGALEGGPWMRSRLGPPSRAPVSSVTSDAAL